MKLWWLNCVSLLNFNICNVDISFILQSIVKMRNKWLVVTEVSNESSRFQIMQVLRKYCIDSCAMFRCRFLWIIIHCKIESVFEEFRENWYTPAHSNISFFSVQDVSFLVKFNKTLHRSDIKYFNKNSWSANRSDA